MPDRVNCPVERGCGGIGRRTRFRFWRREAWGFESLHPHHFLLLISCNYCGKPVRGQWRSAAAQRTKLLVSCPLADGFLGWGRYGRLLVDSFRNGVTVTNYSIFAVETDQIVREDVSSNAEQWRLLRRLKLPDRINDPLGGAVKKAVILDVETTGLSHLTDEVIQLAVLPFTYEVETGRILEVLHREAYEGMREPEVEISAEAAAVTGLTADMVAGQQIDDAQVEAILDKVDLVIAHNAGFDRPMVEKHWPVFSKKPWACSLTGVEWLEEGFTAGKLDYLGMRFGWFFDGHRALADCEACLALLAQELPVSGKTVMSLVREAARRSEYLIQAKAAPFQARQLLKERGYRWRPEDLKNGKVWWTITSNPEAELAWLAKDVYQAAIDLPVSSVNAMNRYSESVWTG